MVMDDSIYDLLPLLFPSRCMRTLPRYEEIGPMQFSRIIFRIRIIRIMVIGKSLLELMILHGFFISLHLKNKFFHLKFNFVNFGNLEKMKI